MTAHVLAALIRAQAVAGLAVLAVLMLRPWLRSAFGPGAAYRLWALPPVAAVAALIPSPFVTEAEAFDWTGVEALAGRLSHPGLWLTLFATGLIATGAWALAAQLVFLRQVRLGRAGPAAIGLFRPRIVLPADHLARYTPEALAVIRAHERAHIDRGDQAANVALLIGLLAGWCNPLVQLACRLARLDQELACDRTVLERCPSLRRTYAEALLASHAGAPASPLACAWLVRHPLEARIALLARADARIDPRLHLQGGLTVLTLGMIAALAAWLSAPPSPAAEPMMSASNVPMVIDLSPPAAQGH